MTDHCHRDRVASVTGACGCYLVDCRYTSQ
jgi:hypothetical protein